MVERGDYDRYSLNNDFSQVSSLYNQNLKIGSKPMNVLNNRNEISSNTLSVSKHHNVNKRTDHDAKYMWRVSVSSDLDLN